MSSQQDHKAEAGLHNEIGDPVHMITSAFGNMIDRPVLMTVDELGPTAPDPDRLTEAGIDDADLQSLGTVPGISDPGHHLQVQHRPHTCDEYRTTERDRHVIMVGPPGHITDLGPLTVIAADLPNEGQDCIATTECQSVGMMSMTSHGRGAVTKQRTPGYLPGRPISGENRGERSLMWITILMLGLCMVPN